VIPEKVGHIDLGVATVQASTTTTGSGGWKDPAYLQRSRSLLAPQIPSNSATMRLSLPTSQTPTAQEPTPVPSNKQVRADRAPTFATASIGALEVSAVPPAPSSFSGLVGNYELQATAEPRELKVGEPTQLTVTLSGQPYMADAKLPAVEQQPELIRDFKVERSPADFSAEGPRKFFRYRLRPKREDIRFIPPLEVTLFDPSEGSFVPVRTQAIPLTVLPTRVVTAADAEGAVQKAELPQPVPPSQHTDGSKEGVTVSELLSSGKALVVEKLHNPFWQAVLLAIVVLPVAVVGYRLAARFRAAQLARPVPEPSPLEEFTRAIEGTPVRASNVQHSVGSWAEMAALRSYLRRSLD
jgi:hypothetical protein